MTTTLERQPKTRSRPALKQRLRRGQSMVEYSIVTHVLLVGGGFALMPVMSKLFDAMSQFYKGIFFVITSGAI